MNLKHYLNKKENRRLLFVLSTALVLVLLAFSVPDSPGDKKNTDLSTSGEDDSNLTLTKYQKVFVDCPREYLEVCTDMSRQGTDELSFIREEDGYIYLSMEKNRTMVVKLQNNGTEGVKTRIEK